MVGAITAVSQEAAQVLESAGEGPLGETLLVISFWIDVGLLAWGRDGGQYTGYLNKNPATLSFDILDLGKPEMRVSTDGSIAGVYTLPFT